MGLLNIFSASSMLLNTTRSVFLVQYLFEACARPILCQAKIRRNRKHKHEPILYLSVFCKFGDCLRSVANLYYARCCLNICLAAKPKAVVGVSAGGYPLRVIA